MKVIAICNTKGGVGKSTLTAALAVRAAQGGKRRVAVVDLDAQESLIEWFASRADKSSPEVFAGEQNPADAVEKLSLTGWDIVFMDGPPSFFNLVREMIAVSDLVVIPLRPSIADLRSTEDCVVMTRQGGKPMLCVLNDVTRTDRTIETTRAVLTSGNVPVAETVMHHRVSHVKGFAVGKTAAEVNGGRDKDAAAEIDALWLEVAKAVGLNKRVRS